MLQSLVERWEKIKHDTTVDLDYPFVVNIVSIMVDIHGSIVDQCRNPVHLIVDKIPESILLGMIHQQRHQRVDGRRFQLAEMMTYFMTSLDKLDQNCLRTLPNIPMDIIVPPSLFCFHDVHCVWLIFREEVCIRQQGFYNQKPLAISILKNDSNDKKSLKKQVRISQDLPRYQQPKRKKTIKIYH